METDAAVASHLARARDPALTAARRASRRKECRRMLHVTLNVKHGPKDEHLERLLEREKQRIVTRLGGELLERAALHCEVDRNVHRKEGYASLTLDLPSGSLNAHGKGRSHLVALRHAADALIAEIKKRRELRRESRRDASLRHVDLADLAPATSGNGAVTDASSFDPEVEQAIAATLPEVESFVERELARHSELFGAVDGPRIDVSDVVEEALLRAVATRGGKPADVPFDRYLISCAYDVLVAEEERLEGLRGAISLDSEPDLDVRPLQDGVDVIENTDRFQDAEIFADLVPDARARGADVELLARDFRYAVMSAIRHLPPDERKVLSMVALEGLEPREAANRLRRAEDGVRALVEQARDAVRRELLAKGY
jgi:RNA polymerase sigma factor (sigma-70 family)